MMMSHVAMSAKVGGLQALSPISQTQQPRKCRNANSISRVGRMASLAGRVRCEVGKGPLTDAKEIVDRNTKNTITKDDILRNQDTNESEKKSVMGTEPTSGSLYPHPRWRGGQRQAASPSGASLPSMAPLQRPSTAAWYDSSHTSLEIADHCPSYSSFR